MCIASIMQTWYLCLFHTQVYCIVCIFPHVTQKCVVLTFEYSMVSLEAVNKPFYGFSQYMCNSVEVVKKMYIRQMFDRSDTVSTSARPIV
jgi:hypothetical protein